MGDFAFLPSVKLIIFHDDRRTRNLCVSLFLAVGCPGGRLDELYCGLLNHL